MQFLPIVQALLGLMTFFERMNAPGATKKELVLTAFQAATPLLPASTQQNIRDEAPQVAQVMGVASELVDALHGVAKKHNLYPQLEQTFAAASDILDGVRDVAVAVGD